jgi:hypothetical protein
MANEKVDISVDAKVANAIANLADVARAQGSLGDAAEESGRKGARGAREFAGELEHVVGRWTAITTYIDLAREALVKYLETAKKLREEQVASTKVIDTGLTGYRIAQGNLSGPAGLEAASRISAVAQQSKAGNQAAFSAASLLAQYGVGRQQAEGPALAELLHAQDLAQAQGNIDPNALARGILDALQRSRRPITGPNIRALASSAYTLGTKVKGFDAGELGITADVATIGRDAGLGLEQTMAIVGALSEDYGEGSAKKRFRSLFAPGKHSVDEQRQVAALRARALRLLSGSAGDYATATGIAGGSMADEEAQAQSQYEASGFTPGILDAAAVRNRFLAARRKELGVSAIDQGLQGFRFDVLNLIGGPEYAIRNLTDGGFGSAPSDAANARIRARALGQQEFTVRLLGPDGRDVPVQSEANALNVDYSNDATQSTNFRP